MSEPAIVRLVDHLFRHEAGRLSAILTRLLGVGSLDLAEDVVQDTLAQALSVWRFGRVPENPVGWIRRVARNRAIDIIRKRRTELRFEPDLKDQLTSEWSLVPTVDRLFLDGEVQDGILRLMFSCCSPRISPDVQVVVILKLLGGLGVRELSHAFLASEDAIEKKLTRGKAALRAQGELADVTDPAQLVGRLEGVCRALYLLFNEGYHGSHPEHAIQADLCEEALRLGRILAHHHVTGQPMAKAMLALFCLQAARLPARVDASGCLVPLDEQDRVLWNHPLLQEGLDTLASSASGDALTEFHLEAAIAASHGLAASFAQTDWEQIVALYSQLWHIKPTPVVALNRAIAIGQARGAEAGLAAIDAIPDAEKLTEYVFYHASRADLLRRAGRLREAAADYQAGIAVARNPTERLFLRRRLQDCL